ncbi:diiron oxygenase [Gordonia defluvii]|uniref:Diiron oxygenase n=1 Tax=Gordonia defluvii TaxID=283718 RepID=A0ABN3Y7S9_9ACTN|nr:diiron oxygenase [Gordonia sp. UBA5067]
MTSTLNPQSTSHQYVPVAKSQVREDYHQVLDDLSDASVHRNFDPYLDIDWDSPQMAVVPNDRRWIMSPHDPVGRHRWFAEQPVDKQIAMGMWRQANVAKVGLQFESILIRGLMQYSDRLPNGAKEFRYTTHEAKEECNHTLMFQEFVNRTGVDVPGGPRWFRRLSPIIPLFSTIFPSVFYFGVLAGEEPIDHIQKEFLRKDQNLHPTMQAIMQLHVAEEARHISFAHHLLRESIPKKGPLTRFALSITMPIVMRLLCEVIAKPPREFRRTFDIPRSVWKEQFWRSPQSRQFLANVFGDVRMLAEQCGLMNPVSRRVWRLMRISGRPSRYRSEPTYSAAA